MMLEWLRFEGFPIPAVLLGLAIATELVGGVLLILGLRVRWVALVLALYPIPVTFAIHDFWVIQDATRQGAREQFGKGLMIMGGLLFVHTLGAGALSLDRKLEGRRVEA